MIKEVFKHWMAYKNHQSAQLGIEQSVFVIYPNLNAVFLDLHVILIRTCAACNLDRYAARCYPRMWPKAKIEFTVSFLHSRVTQNTKINLYTKV